MPVPVTRLLGQSPSGLSATGDSDTRNYYDMPAARQELDLRPQLGRLDRLILRSEGLDPSALSFTFRPLWQLDAPAKAALALTKAQATQVYAGLNLWPAAVTAKLVEAQLVQDGTYPNAAAVFAEAGAADPASAAPTLDFDPAQPRDLWGKWRAGAGASTASAVERSTGATTPARAPSNASGGILGFLSALNPIGTARAQDVPPEEARRRSDEPADSAELQPGEVIRLQRFEAAWRSLKAIDPTNRELNTLEPPGYVPADTDIARIEGAAREASIARTCDFLRPGGQPIGKEGTSPNIRLLPGGLVAAQSDFDYLSVGGNPLPMPNGSRVWLPGGAGFIMLRPVSSTPGSPAIDVHIPGLMRMKLHY